MSTPHLTLTRPDDWHLHLRDDAMLAAVLPHTARCFARAIVMPNLKPPVTTVAQAQAYRERILAALPAGMAFEPLMTLYLTEATTPEDIAEASASGFVHAVKYYPAGATTNAASGVTDLRRCYPVFEAMQKHKLPLLMHGEVTDPAVDVFDREPVFVERHLTTLRRDFPALRMVLEHITTREAAQFVREAPAHVGATITPQHLLMNRNAIFAGGLRPHSYCLPVLKRESHRQALVAVATSGDPSFFLGTDSAPHPRHAKESSCGCAGIYSAHAAIELYAEAFEEAGALDRLEAFASFHGPDFYGLPRNTSTITLHKAPWVVPEEMDFGGTPGVPMRAGETIGWRLQA
ncbi:dihydroorotase [Frateuria sp. MAH-13]|uniref:Dihydroorotase n=1 Tax=Frateuria flava TaxID=2821489 RepID=A0ABS4DNB5_9GAMM|nr:dihydroorotase [Frateuria flava]MBP1474510.1 dihydroorotase [Frateuria flava]